MKTEEDARVGGKFPTGVDFCRGEDYDKDTTEYVVHRSRERDKREAGENPAQSRCCIGGAAPKKPLERMLREGGGTRRSLSQNTCLCRTHKKTFPDFGRVQQALFGDKGAVLDSLYPPGCGVFLLR